MLQLLWWASLLVVIAGSLFPFDFTPAAETEAAWQALKDFDPRSGRGDILGNVVLFLPCGFFGMLAYRKGPWAVRAGLVLGIAFVVAWGVQLAQVWLPSRDAKGGDVVWNMLGMLPGMVAAGLPWAVLVRRLFGQDARIAAAPLAVIGVWLIARLMPLVPSIDWSLWKDSLKPLLQRPEMDPVQIGWQGAAWVAVGYLLWAAEARRRLDWFLPLIVAGTLFGEVVIVDNTIGLPGTLAAVGGMLLWLCVLRWIPGRGVLVALLMTGGIAVYALEPFSFGETAREFRWMPFTGMLQGKMWINAQVILEKVALYGMLVFALAALVKNRLWLATPVAAIMLLGLEWQQRLLGTRLPESTDAILAVLMGLTLIGLAQIDIQASGAPASPGQPSRRARTGGKRTAPYLRPARKSFDHDGREAAPEPPRYDDDGREYVKLD